MPPLPLSSFLPSCFKSLLEKSEGGGGKKNVMHSERKMALGISTVKGDNFVPLKGCALGWGVWGCLCPCPSHQKFPPPFFCGEGEEGGRIQLYKDLLKTYHELVPPLFFYSLTPCPFKCQCTPLLLLSFLHSAS